MGTKYEEMKYFNIGENIKFTVNFGYEKVESVKISLADEIPSSIDITDAKQVVEKWWPFAGLIVLMYAL